MQSSHKPRSALTMLKLSPNQQFGAMFTALFAVLAAVSYIRGGSFYAWFAGLSGLTALVTLLRPQSLGGLHAAWMRLAALLNRIVSPLVLAAMFFVILTPVGLLRRMFGHDSMRRKFEHAAHSYWIAREPPNSPSDSMRNQF